MSMFDPALLAAKAAVVSSAGLVVLALLRRQRAALRAAVAAATLAGMLALPFVGRIWPSVVAPVPTVTVPKIQPRVEAVSQISTPRISTTAVAASAPSSVDVETILVALWLLGTLVAITRVLVGWASTRQLVRESQHAGESWQHSARERARLIGVARDVPVLAHATLSVPVTAGVFNPTIIVPASADAWTDERRALVLAHELAHVRRHDCFVDYIARIACSVYWFLPMVWRLASQLRVDRERSCDDVVLALGVTPPDYAEHLVDLATAARATNTRMLHAAALAMAPIGSLEVRVTDILSATRRRGAMSRVARWTVAAVSMAIVVPISALAPHVEQPGAFALRGPVDTVDHPLGLNERVVWRGPVDAGATVSLRANMGDVIVDVGTTREVVITAQRRAWASSLPADTRLSVITGANGIVACSVYVDPERGRSPCETNGQWGRTNVENNDVSLRVLVPTNVHVRVQAGNGDVRIADVRGNVHVLDANGDVNVSNEGTADLTALTGALAYTRIGTSDPGPISLRVLHGEISARLPHGAAVDAAADTGIVTVSSRNLSSAIRTDRYSGSVGGGGSPLVARVQKGVVNIAIQP